MLCALGHHVLLESKEEQVKEPLEPGRQSYRKLGKRLPSIDLNVTAEQWLEQLTLDQIESVLRLACTIVTTSLQLFKVIALHRVLQKHDRNSAWTDDCNLSFKFPAEYLYQILLNGLIAGGLDKKEGRQACYFSARTFSKARQYLIRKVGNYRSLRSY